MIPYAFDTEFLLSLLDNRTIHIINQMMDMTKSIKVNRYRNVSGLANELSKLSYADIEIGMSAGFLVYPLRNFFELEFDRRNVSIKSYFFNVVQFKSNRVMFEILVTYADDTSRAYFTDFNDGPAYNDSL